MVWQERRSAIRHTIELPIKCRILSENKEAAKSPIQLRNRVKDISDGGLLFLSNRSFSIGTLLELTFPVQDKVFTMQGRVVHASKDIESKLFRTGIRFSKSDSVFKVKMAEQVYQIDEYRKTLSREEGRVVSQEEAAIKWIEKHSREFAEFYH